MFKIIRERRGSLSLETAILLPLVIIAVLSIAFILKVNSSIESVMAIATDESRKLAIEAYTPAGGASAVTFSNRLEKRVKLEHTEIENVNASRLLYLYNFHGLNKLISFDLTYEMEPKPGLSMTGPIYVKEHILTRAFVGQDDYRHEEGFKLLEEEEESELCYVFPRAGEKHHKKNCRYIQNYAVKMTLGTRATKRFKPCKLCNAGNLKNGAGVYCFPKTGEVYHRESCNAVEKYVVEMEKAEAEKKGYAPCSVCGG